MSIEEASEAAWRAMALECARPDSYGRRWYRARLRARIATEDHDDLAQEYERQLHEAHAIRVLLVQRDGE